jgi:hypothetical protein
MAIHEDCPMCGERIQDIASFEWLAPHQGFMDVGYCRPCSRGFHVERESGRHKSLTFAPLCRECRDETKPDGERSDDGELLYRCSKHPNQVWKYGPGGTEWTWAGLPESSPREGRHP